MGSPCSNFVPFGDRAATVGLRQAGLQFPILLALLPGVELCRRGPPCLVSGQFLSLVSEFTRRDCLFSITSPFHALPGQPHGFPYTRSCLGNTRPCYSPHFVPSFLSLLNVQPAYSRMSTLDTVAFTDRTLLDGLRHLQPRAVAAPCNHRELP